MKKVRKTKATNRFEEYKLYFTPKKKDCLFILFKKQTPKLGDSDNEAYFCYSIPSTPKEIPHICINQSKVNITTLAHECLHAVFWYFRKNKWSLPKQKKYTSEDEERFNHIFAYLFEQAIHVAPNLHKRKDHDNKYLRYASKIHNFTY